MGSNRKIWSGVGLSRQSIAIRCFAIWPQMQLSCAFRLRFVKDTDLHMRVIYCLTINEDILQYVGVFIAQSDSV